MASRSEATVEATAFRPWNKSLQNAGFSPGDRNPVPAITDASHPSDV